MCANGSSTPRLVLLPGMGTDARLFAPQYEMFPHLEVPDWIEPRPRECLPAYAQRWAATVDRDPDLVLGGVSFGGMVALEAARHVRPRAVVLISTCRSGDAIALLPALVGRIGWAIPARLLDRMSGVLTLGFSWLEGLGTDERRLLGELIADSSPELLRWAIPTALSWRHDPNSLPREIPVRQIHGGRDRVISPQRSGAEEVIQDAGHLMNVTHADAVNSFIRQVL